MFPNDVVRPKEKSASIIAFGQIVAQNRTAGSTGAGSLLLEIKNLHELKLKRVPSATDKK